MKLSVIYVFSAILRVFLAFLRTLLKPENWCVIFMTKEVKTMKNSKTLIAKIAKAAAEKALKADANQTTCVFFYQPKAPVDLKRFKKNKV